MNVAFSQCFQKYLIFIENDLNYLNKKKEDITNERNEIFQK